MHLCKYTVFNSLVLRVIEKALVLHIRSIHCRFIMELQSVNPGDIKHQYCKASLQGWLHPLLGCRFSHQSPTLQIFTLLLCTLTAHIKQLQLISISQTRYTSVILWWGSNKSRINRCSMFWSIIASGCYSRAGVNLLITTVPVNSSIKKKINNI